MARKSSLFCRTRLAITETSKMTINSFHGDIKGNVSIGDYAQNTYTENNNSQTINISGKDKTALLEELATLRKQEERTAAELKEIAELQEQLETGQVSHKLLSGIAAGVGFLGSIASIASLVASLV